MKRHSVIKNWWQRKELYGLPTINARSSLFAYRREPEEKGETVGISILHCIRDSLCILTKFICPGRADKKGEFRGMHMDGRLCKQL